MDTMTQQTQAPSDEVGLLDYWRVIWKHRWMIGSTCAAAVLTTLVIGLQATKVYESSVTLLSSLDSKEGGGGLGALLAASGAAGGSAGGPMQSLGISLPGASATSIDIFLSLLKSRIMADEVIKHFSLMSLYKTKSMQAARGGLEGATKIVVNKERVIKITVEATSPQMAADMANFYVSNLDRLNRTLNISKASQNRAFIERRLAETQITLRKTEEVVKDFKIRNKIVAVEPQANAMFQAAAGIQAQIIAQEVQSQVMRSYLTQDHPELSRVESSIEELKKQLHHMESGKEGEVMIPGDRLHPAIITVPGVALNYGRLTRELRLQETLNALLTSQLEQAKLTEARDTPTVQVLDPAIPAEWASKPNIRFNMVMTGLLAPFLGIFLSFFLEYLKRIRAVRRQVSGLNPHYS